MNGGAGQLNDNWTNTNSIGGLAGGQVGCNYQTGMIVVGVEGEGFWSGLRTTANFNNSNPETDIYSTNNAADFDVAVRLGVAFDRALIYGKAGVVWGRFGYSGTDADSVVTIQYNINPATLDGLLIGLGAEYGITTNWTVKFEYDYLGFAARDVNVTETCSGSSCGGYPFYFTEPRSANTQIVKLGLNYKFDWGR